MPGIIAKSISIVFINVLFFSEVTSRFYIYEYGVREPDDFQAYFYKGIVPRYKPEIVHNITITDKRLSKNFTYVRAEFYNKISPVVTRFDTRTSILRIIIRFPFLETHVGIAGYARAAKLWHKR